MEINISKLKEGDTIAIKFKNQKDNVGNLFTFFEVIGDEFLKVCDADSSVLRGTFREKLIPIDQIALLFRVREKFDEPEEPTQWLKTEETKKELEQESVEGGD